MRKLFSLLAAVLFAGSMVAAVKEYTVTIGQSNFPGNSYAANNGVHKSTAVAADESTMEVEWTSNQVMWSSNKIQGQKNTGYIYNAASWGTVKSITINDNENFAFLIGSEAQPTATAEGGFFKISAGSATSKASSIVIVFDADASVPVLKANDVVLGTVIFEGESGSKLDSVAITAANLTEDIAVSTTSAKITLGATSVDKAGGVLKFTVNSGEGEINDTITLTSGELVAKVAVTGHFYAKVKNPGIAATFEAGPENSQGGDSTFVNGDKAVKAGTSNNAGSAVISLPANAVKLHFMAAAWNGKPCTMTLSTEDATLDVDSINLIADAGIANTSPFFTAEGDLTKYQHTVNISGADDDITIVATTKGTNKRFVIWDVTYEMSEEPQPDMAVIKFMEPKTADQLPNDTAFVLFGSDFRVQITDPDNKITIDANPCRFGTAEAYDKYTHRLKSGGKSSADKNFITVNMPKAGLLGIAVRTSSGSDTTRTLVAVQGNDTLYNEIVRESQAIKVMEDTTQVSVYPYIVLPAAAGSVVLSYPVNALNFYAFTYIEAPAPTDEPAAAPAEPTWPESQVKAVYSAKYVADCGFGEWGSGTVYAQEAFGKKYVTTDLGYFGLTFDGEGQHLNCSKMEYLHLDVWIAQDTTIRVVPIIAGSAEPRNIYARLEANKWNAIDIALADFENVANWMDVYQIKIDEARNMTFWLNNVYFYTTQAPEADSIAPKDFTAELTETSFYSVRIKAHATDNSGFVKYDVINGEILIGSGSGESGADAIITVKNLAANTDYNLKVVAKDESGNMADPIELAVKTLAAPAPAHAPTVAAENVVSLYSDAYTTATTYETLNQNWWMGPALMVEDTLAANDHVLYYADFAEGGAFGWAFNENVDAAGFQKLHLDIYPTGATSFIVWPVIQPEADYKTTTEELVANQWNELIIDLTDKTFAPFKQFGWVVNKAIPGFFVDNVYFFKDAQGIDNTADGVKAVKYIRNGMLLIEKNGKVYTITGQVVR